MAEPLTSVEYVDAYDKNTGEKLANPVPRSWVEAGSPFPHLSATPRQKAADKPQIKTPAKSADKPTWVKFATSEAPESLRLHKDAAEAMSVEDLHTYYSTAQEG